MKTDNLYIKNSKGEFEKLGEIETLDLEAPRYDNIPQWWFTDKNLTSTFDIDGDTKCKTIRE